MTNETPVAVAFDHMEVKINIFSFLFLEIIIIMINPYPGDRIGHTDAFITISLYCSLLSGSLSFFV